MLSLAASSTLALAPTPMRTAGVSMQASSSFSIRDMPGITAPFGFFDPMGFSADASEGKLRFYREAELKHGRVAMLASLGFLVGEHFHPIFSKVNVISERRLNPHA